MSTSSNWNAAADGFSRIDETKIHQGYVWSLSTATFQAPDGATFERDIVRSPGSVGIVPITETAAGPAVTLVAQYRPAYERAILEIPAGMRDVDGESPEATARRELVEEVGLHAAQLHMLTEMIPSPGMTDAVCTIYVATGCSAVADNRQGPEEEHMVLVELMLNEALQLVDAGAIGDSKTALGLLMADRFLTRDQPDGD